MVVRVRTDCKGAPIVATETRLIDYSDARPAPSAIVEAGYDGVMRYLAPLPNEKVLTAAEAKSLHGRKLVIGCQWESTATRAEGGIPAGKTDRGTAEAEAKKLKYPKACPIFYAVDEDAQWDQVADYFTGIDTAAGQHPWGIYGGYYIVEACHRAHPKALIWQAVAWSESPDGAEQISEHANLYQRLHHTGEAIPGGGYDEDVVLKTLTMWGPAGAVTVSPKLPHGRPKPEPGPKPTPPKPQPDHGGKKKHRIRERIRELRERIRKLLKKLRRW